MQKRTIMRTIIRYATFVVVSFWLVSSYGQEKETSKIEDVATAKEQIVAEERAKLKEAVEEINAKIADQTISKEAAQAEKEALAKKHASNIEDRIQILENKYALLKRNGTDTIAKVSKQFRIGVGDEDDYILGIKVKNEKKKPKYDIRTYTGPVIAIGLNNAYTRGQNIRNWAYRHMGSRFFELGWNWRTRVFKESNWLRVNYGFSFQFNGLKPAGNGIFVREQGETVLDSFPLNLKKSKLRMDNLVFPVHFELGPSKLKKSEDKMRYDTDKSFKIGFGGYAGFSLNTVQKLKYTNEDGERIKQKNKEGFDRSSIVYGLSGYIGFGDVLLYTKYDISPIFNNATVPQYNVSFGIRLEL